MKIDPEAGAEAWEEMTDVERIYSAAARIRSTKPPYELDKDNIADFIEVIAKDYGEIERTKSLYQFAMILQSVLSVILTVIVLLLLFGVD